MSVNKKNRSLWGSRSEAQRIYYQRQTIKRLEKENEKLKEKCEKQQYAIKENCDLRLEIEQLKENNLTMQEEMCRTWEKLNIIKELRSWLEESKKIAVAQEHIRSINAINLVLDKLNELEEGDLDEM